MTSMVRLILVMGARVNEFLIAFPDPNPGFQQAAQGLAERLARAEALASQQQKGKVSRRVTSGQRKALLRGLRTRVLRLLEGVARAAFKDEPDIIRRFRVPVHNGAQLDFLTAARAVLAEAEAAREVLLQHGLPATLLSELSAGLEAYDALVMEANAGVRASVGASADLEAVTAEIAAVVRHLDALNRYRYRDNPEQLAAWVSARHIPYRKPKEEIPVPVPVPPVTVSPAEQQPVS